MGRKVRRNFLRRCSSCHDYQRSCVRHSGISRNRWVLRLLGMAPARSTTSRGAGWDRRSDRLRRRADTGRGCICWSRVCGVRWNLHRGVTRLAVAGRTATTEHRAIRFIGTSSRSWLLFQPRSSEQNRASAARAATHATMVPRPGYPKCTLFGRRRLRPSRFHPTTSDLTGDYGHDRHAPAVRALTSAAPLRGGRPPAGDRRRPRREPMRSAARTRNRKGYDRASA